MSKTSKAQAQWQQVFKFAVSIANAKRKTNPNLTYPQAMKKAWQDPKVLAKKKEYERKRGAGKITQKKSSSAKTTSKKNSSAKTTSKKSSSAKTTTRKTTTRKTPKRTSTRKK